MELRSKPKKIYLAQLSWKLDVRFFISLHVGIRLKNYATTQELVMLRFTQNRATNGYNWVKREDGKYWKINNNLDDQISVWLACVTFFPCLKNEPSISNVEIGM